MSNLIQIIKTGDGSQSLINTDLNETYHSMHGAVQESRHVFIERGLMFVLQKNQDLTRVLEIGFGTGLNAILTLDAAENSNRKIHYMTIDNFSLAGGIWKKLDFEISSRENFEKLHSSAWNQPSSITSFFELHKVQNRAQDVMFERTSFDLVYFDAFAPSKQPEMWEVSILEKMYGALRHGGVFVTYCAKGQVKRDLKSIGFVVETLEGPPGKKEMIRAVKS